MAFLKNPMAKVVGNANPSKIDLVCEVKVQFTDLDRAILQNAQNVAAFQIHVAVRSSDGVPDTAQIPLNMSLGDINVSLSMGNPDAQVFLTKTFNRGGALNEDPYPFPNQEDEIMVDFLLTNLFSHTELASITSPLVRGNF